MVRELIPKTKNLMKTLSKLYSLYNAFSVNSCILSLISFFVSPFFVVTCFLVYFFFLLFKCTC